jgi:hypothetical protein
MFDLKYQLLLNQYPQDSLYVSIDHTLHKFRERLKMRLRGRRCESSSPVKFMEWSP